MIKKFWDLILDIIFVTALFYATLGFALLFYKGV